jgi:hypothetical protein
MTKMTKTGKVKNLKMTKNEGKKVHFVLKERRKGVKKRGFGAKLTGNGEKRTKKSNFMGQRQEIEKWPI